jgi:hypothetical protein
MGLNDGDREMLAWHPERVVSPFAEPTIEWAAASSPMGSIGRNFGGLEWDLRLTNGPRDVGHKRRGKESAAQVKGISSDRFFEPHVRFSALGSRFRRRPLSVCHPWLSPRHSPLKGGTRCAAARSRRGKFFGANDLFATLAARFDCRFRDRHFLA